MVRTLIPVFYQTATAMMSPLTPDQDNGSFARTILADIQNAAVALAGQRILHDISLQISTGEIVTIVGPNGSGKTTLLRLLIGAVTPDHGKIVRSADLRIGYVPQKLHIDPTLPITVTRFLQLPDSSPADVVARSLETAGVTHLGSRQMSNLSGGEFQRVMLARALLNNPQLLILDEATQGLDQAGSAAFYKRLAMVRDQLGCAVLMVSHELHVVMAASDRVICLNGHVCCQGTPEHVSAAPEYLELFGPQIGGALAVYRHRHDHHHHDEDDHHHSHDHRCGDEHGA